MSSASIWGRRNNWTGFKEVKMSSIARESWSMILSTNCTSQTVSLLAVWSSTIPFKLTGKKYSLPILLLSHTLIWPKWLSSSREKQIKELEKAKNVNYPLSRYYQLISTLWVFRRLGNTFDYGHQPWNR